MLIEQAADHVAMFGYVFITLLVIMGPLAYLTGVDSRIDEKSRDRSFTG